MIPSTRYRLRHDRLVVSVVELAQYGYAGDAKPNEDSGHNTRQQKSLHRAHMLNFSLNVT